MGVGISTTVTNNKRWKRHIDENKMGKNIVELKSLLLLLDKDYKDPGAHLVRCELVKERPFAMNFQIKLKKFSDLYNDSYSMTIIKITNWHAHLNWLGEPYDFFLGIYLQLLASNKENDVLYLPFCLCVLTDEQLKLYEHLANSSKSKIT